MGYFANGSEGDAYVARWCARCLHEEGCPVWELHLLYNYDQQKRPTTADALASFIPRPVSGGNGRCVMFVERPADWVVAEPAPRLADPGQAALPFGGEDRVRGLDFGPDA